MQMRGYRLEDEAIPGVLRSDPLLPETNGAGFCFTDGQEIKNAVPKAPGSGCGFCPFCQATNRQGGAARGMPSRRFFPRFHTASVAMIQNRGRFAAYRASLVHLFGISCITPMHPPEKLRSSA